MRQIIPNYHPLMVHFTIALIMTSCAMLWLGHLLRVKPDLHKESLIVSRWCLWLAAFASILTVIAGFHAYYTVAHDMVSHKVMTTHRNWGIAAFAVIWLANICSFVLYIKAKPPRWMLTLLLTMAAALVMITGWYGAELVFRYGLGVKSLPLAEAAGHQHKGGEHANIPKTTTDRHANHTH